MGNELIIYQIDAQDRIVSVNENWQRFAQANDWTISNADLLGMSLWDFVANADVVQLYRELLTRVRARNIAVTLPLRCDSPTVRRDLQLEIVPLKSGAIEFRSDLVNVQPHPSVLEVIERKANLPGRSLLTVCSWCKRLLITGEWVEIEKGVIAMGLLDMHDQPALTHGACLDCINQMMSVLPN